MYIEVVSGSGVTLSGAHRGCQVVKSVLGRLERQVLEGGFGLISIEHVGFERADALFTLEESRLLKSWCLRLISEIVGHITVLYDKSTDRSYTH